MGSYLDMMELVGESDNEAEEKTVRESMESICAFQFMTLNDAEFVHPLHDFSILMKVVCNQDEQQGSCEFLLYLCGKQNGKDTYIFIPENTITSKDFCGPEELRNVGTLTWKQLEQYSFDELCNVFHEYTSNQWN